MHEFGYVNGILDAVRDRAAGRPVTRVALHVGIMHRIDAVALSQAFEVVASGTEADGAAIDLTQVPAELACANCPTTMEVTDPLALCPACGSADVSVTGGDELLLASITLAEPSPPPGPAAPEASGGDG